MKILLSLLLVAPLSAEAFCGFYVSGAGGKLFNDASMVVLLRDGTRTVLSMQNNYRGPADDFALVVPVPVVLQKENVKTMPREAFTRLDELTAPRLVEMYTNNCPAMGIGGLGTMGGGGSFGSGAGSGLPRDLGVRVEAKFEVEEYEIVILSAENSLGLQIWLKENKYKIPDGAEAALQPYVQTGSKFFVAKVDAKKAKHQKDGELVLSPLRFSYDSETFSLPVRLGLLNSGGTQELIVHIIAKDRYELANAKNVLIPTNFDVRTRTQPQFGAFYADLLDRTFKKNPRAAVTEFAWEGALPPPTEMQGGGIYGVTCDPCPPPHPVDNPLAKYLGVLSLPKIKTDTGIAEFARGSTITRLHLRYTKDTPPDDLVFKVAKPLVGGTPEAKEAGPGKVNRFQGRYVMWVDGCAGMGGLGGGLGGGGFFTSGSPLNRPQSTEKKLVDPIEELIVADLPALDLKARPLRKDAPHLEVRLDTTPNYTPPPAPLPGFTDLPPVVEGPLDKDLVRRVLRANRGQIRYCYEKNLLRNPALAGKVMLQFVISAEGAVVSSMIANSSLGDADTEACLAGRAKTWMFPKAERVSKVSYPLVFKPQ